MPPQPHSGEEGDLVEQPTPMSVSPLRSRPTPCPTVQLGSIVRRPGNPSRLPLRDPAPQSQLLEEGAAASRAAEAGQTIGLELPGLQLFAPSAIGFAVHGPFEEIEGFVEGRCLGRCPGRLDVAGCSLTKLLRLPIVVSDAWPGRWRFTGQNAGHSKMTTMQSFRRAATRARDFETSRGRFRLRNRGAVPRRRIQPCELR